MAKHGVEAGENLFGKRIAFGFTYRRQTGADSAARSGYFFVGRAGNSLFKINQPGLHESRMSMAIDEAGQNHMSPTIKFFQFALVLLHPCMTQDVTLTADSDDLPTTAEHSRVFDQTNIIESCTTARARLATKSEKLPDVRQEKVGRRFHLLFIWH